MLGVSCVAPAYALTATLGPTVSEVGLQMPAVFLAGFIPMLLVAYAYRELNHEAPDCGTSFTWTVKAFGPHVGWMCGWGFVLATVIVLSNLVGVAVTFFYLLLGNVFGNQAIGALGDNAVVNVLTTLVFVAAPRQSPTVAWRRRKGSSTRSWGCRWSSSPSSSSWPSAERSAGPPNSPSAFRGVGSTPLR